MHDRSVQDDIDNMIKRLVVRKKKDHWGCSGIENDDAKFFEAGKVVGDVRDANLITSRLKDIEAAFKETHHLPLIDFDIPVHLIESSTKGNSHLYIDHPMSFDDYIKLLTVMEEVGIVQRGYLKSTIGRGFGSLRKPGLRKGEEND